MSGQAQRPSHQGTGPGPTGSVGASQPLRRYPMPNGYVDPDTGLPIPVEGEWEDVRAPHASSHPNADRLSEEDPAEIDSAAADDARSMGALAETDMGAFFGADGPIAAALGGYEARASQVAMAQAVQHALLGRKHALIEAPTGTGKSLAYLVPAILSGRPIVIATANKSLQAQLYLKDIPFLAKALGTEIDAVLVKGRSNYICLHKWENELGQQKQFALYDKEHDQIRNIRRWVEQTDSGDVDDLPFLIEPELRPRVVSFPDDCIGQECDFFDRCFVEKMRDRAEMAQVVITNHHLLLNALELGFAGERLLPPSSIYIIDEAHGLEQTATAVFETMVTDYTVEQVLARNILKELVDEDLLEEIRFQNTLAFQEVKLQGTENSYILEGELEEVRKLGSRLADLGQELKENNPYGEPDDGEDRTLTQQRLMLMRTIELLNSTARDLNAVARPRPDGTVIRYVQRVFERKRVTLELHAAPVNPANLLSKYLFDPQDEGGRPGRMVICTSATLATAGSFAHFRTRCGITSPTIEAILSPVFDYEQQALLYQPPLPGYDHRAADSYYVAVAAEIERLLQVSRGRALCLFTSWNGMQQVAQRLPPRSTGGIIWPIRSQGDAPREALLAWFKSTPHSVLLATRSFWEGVDIPGDDLSLVVLDKLPFPSPGDPLTSARMSEVDGAGSSSFGDYMIPLMTLTLKQGFGRLIRRGSDRGVVAILDERLSSKAYGRQVRHDLPPARFSREYRDVHRFFQNALENDAEFALNVWAWADENASPASSQRTGRWQWQLVRLLDGRASANTGTFSLAVHINSGNPDGRNPDEHNPDERDADEGLHMAAELVQIEGELLALSHGLGDLHNRVQRAGRAPSQFAVEIRCSPQTASLLHAKQDAKIATPPALAQAQTALASWRAAYLLPLSSDTAAPALSSA